VIGNARSLCVDERWRNLVASALERRLCYSPAKPYEDYMAKVGVGLGGGGSGSGVSGGGGL
jgi:hypothetical protein